MKLSTVAVTASILSFGNAFIAPRSNRASSSLSMVLEMPKEKKISKLETLKVVSDHLIHPLPEVRPLVSKMLS